MCSLPCWETHLPRHQCIRRYLMKRVLLSHNCGELPKTRVVRIQPEESLSTLAEFRTECMVDAPVLVVGDLGVESDSNRPRQRCVSRRR